MIPRVAIASNALGRAPAGHRLETKFDAAARAGFEGIELAWECLHHCSVQLRPSGATIRDSLRAAAHYVKHLAIQHKLVLVALQPFFAYDALRPGEQLESRFEDALLWLELCDIMEIKIMQVPTCLYPLTVDDVSTNLEDLSRNMARLADAAEKYGITLGYEAPAWGIAIDTWQQIQEVIRMTGKTNIKHCLDTFHIAALVAGDPKNEHGDWLRKDSIELMQADSKKMKDSLVAADIAYFQLSDAESVDLSQKNYVAPDLNQPFHMTWSRNCRVFPYEGILPLAPCVKAVFDTGFRGWVSMEVFHTELSSSDVDVPLEWARRGMQSWDRIKSAYEW